MSSSFEKLSHFGRFSRPMRSLLNRENLFQPTFVDRWEFPRQIIRPHHPVPRFAAAELFEGLVRAVACTGVIKSGKGRQPVAHPRRGTVTFP